MTKPGRGLRVLCARVCSARTMERFIDPVLSDLQTEYRQAREQSRVWRSRWIRAAGYVALAKVLFLYGSEQALRNSIVGWTTEDAVDDRRALRRMLAFFVAGTVVVIGVALVPPALRLPGRLVAYVIPQLLPFAIPLGVTVGVFCGLGGRVPSRRIVGAALLMALVCTVGSFVTGAWIIPASGTAFRASVAEQAHRGPSGPSKGPYEATLGELRERLDVLRAAARQDRGPSERTVRHAALAYHTRWALPFGVLALTLFALFLLPRRPVRPAILLLVACGAWLGYVFLFTAGHSAVRGGALPVLVALWLPNLLFAAAPAAWLAARHGRARTAN